jgi:peroxiredoxin
MKIKVILILVAVLLTVVLSVFFLSNKIHQTQQKKAVYNTLPIFQLPDINGKMITESDLQSNKPVLFLYFNPDCELCREEFIQIKFNQDAFRNFQIVFFSSTFPNTIIQFLHEIDFIPTPNMLFLIDDREELADKMEVKTSPASYIYQQGKLVKRFDGSVKIETLISYLSNKDLQ